MEAAAYEQSCRQVATKINVETLNESYHLDIHARAFCIQSPYSSPATGRIEVNSELIDSLSYCFDLVSLINNYSLDVPSFETKRFLQPTKLCTAFYCHCAMTNILLA